ncbi:MAG: permease [Acidobacteriota bacterium]
MSEAVVALDPAPRARLGPLVVGALLLSMTAAALVTYKASAALATIAKVEKTGTLGPKAEWIPTAALPAAARPFAGTANYFSWVLIALTFGVLLGAIVKSLIPDAWLARTLAGRGVQGQLVAAIAGAPLMLCSCCVAPVFEGVYERTRRLGPALGLMLASPALNPAAIALTFMLFPASIAYSRLVLAIALVLLASSLLGRAFPDTRAAECPVDWQRPAYGGMLRGFFVALGQVMWRSVPAIALGVLASAAITGLVPVQSLAGSSGAMIATVAVALLAVPLAMPTFGEIPIGLALLSAGAPQGAVLALLLAGPSVNLPSLLTLARVVSVRVAIATAATVFVLASAGGLILGR